MNLLAQGLSLNVFHRDEVKTIGLTNLVDVRDVRMIERSRGGRLLFETAHPILIHSDVRRKHFQRDFASQRSVLRQIDLTHTSRADE